MKWKNALFYYDHKKNPFEESQQGLALWHKRVKLPTETLEFPIGTGLLANWLGKAAQYRPCFPLGTPGRSSYPLASAEPI